MKTPQTDTVTLTPEGRVIIPTSLMENVIMETAGCKLWFNEPDQALGLRLLRGAEEPPFVIERVPGEGGLIGELDAKVFLDKVGFKFPAEPVQCEAEYYEQYRMVKVSLSPSGVELESRTKGVLDDYPALED
jgi:hypothetical protein